MSDHAIFRGSYANIVTRKTRSVCVVEVELPIEQMQAFVAAFGAIGRNKLRSALTMLGIFIGVCALIIMLAVGEGARRAIQRAHREGLHHQRGCGLTLVLLQRARAAQQLDGHGPLAARRGAMAGQRGIELNPAAG